MSLKSEAEFRAGQLRAVYELKRNISAIQVVPEGNGRTRLGMIVQLPEGAELQNCGEGFDDRTIKVSWEGQSYYIFLEDVVESSVFRAAGASG